MKYIITENRITDLIGNMIKLNFPKFNHNDCKVQRQINRDQVCYLYYYIDEIGKGKVFAKYFAWSKELMLSREIFFMLESYFGDDKMSFVIDWFNREFNQDAEYVTF